MERKNTSVLELVQLGLCLAMLGGFSFRTHKPASSYPFDRLYALKPKNPV